MREDEPVGFVLAYPDISAAVQRCRGRMWPIKHRIYRRPLV
jgi:hypothetical protein